MNSTHNLSQSLEYYHYVVGHIHLLFFFLSNANMALGKSIVFMSNTDKTDAVITYGVWAVLRLLNYYYYYL